MRFILLSTELVFSIFESTVRSFLAEPIFDCVNELISSVRDLSSSVMISLKSFCSSSIWIFPIWSWACSNRLYSSWMSLISCWSCGGSNTCYWADLEVGDQFRDSSWTSSFGQTCRRSLWRAVGAPPKGLLSTFCGALTLVIELRSSWPPYRTFLEVEYPA